MIYLIASFLFLLLGASLILFTEAQLFHIGWLILMASVAAVVAFLYQFIHNGPTWPESLSLSAQPPKHEQ